MNPILLGGFALGLTALFTAYGAAVRANRLETRGIVGFGTAIGLLATVASYYIMSRASGKPVPPSSLLVNSLMMSLCTGFVIAQALRRHKIETIDEWDLGGVPIVVRHCAPGRIQGFDTLIVPASTRLAGDPGAAGAVVASAGRVSETAIRKVGVVPLERVVEVPAGALSAERIVLVAVHEPMKSVDAGRLRRAVDNAVVQARKSGARKVAVVAGSMRGIAGPEMATVLLPVVRHAARFEGLGFVAVDPQLAAAFRAACAGRGEAQVPVAATVKTGTDGATDLHDPKSP